MNVINSSRGSCENTRKYLDYYLSVALRTETILEVAKHLEVCEACSDELKTREHLRSCLRNAVRRMPVPPGLPEKVKESIRQSAPKFKFPIGLYL